MQENFIKVEKQNLEYANLLLQDYAGKLGALSCILRYTYQQLIQNVFDEDFAEMLFKIQKLKMKQLEIFGKLILLLGGNPQYGTVDSHISSRMIPYTSCGLCYDKESKKFLAYDIQEEELIIKQYKAHQKVIKDVYIQAVFTTIIEEENEILHLLKQWSSKL